MTRKLLSDSDPTPVEVVNAKGSAPFVLTCEHAGRTIPKNLGDLGLAARHLSRHISWDIGAEGLARRMSQHLDAPLVLQRYSRLVIDCNRPLVAPDSIPAVSDGTEVPANANLNERDKHIRADEIHAPYHNGVRALLDDRQRSKHATALVAVHSFTPRLEAKPAPRPWDLGLLYNRHEKLSHEAHAVLQREARHLNVTFNEPYSIDDLEDFTIPVHGEARGIPNVLLEVRNDHLTTDTGQNEWAGLLARVLRTVAAKL